MIVGDNMIQNPHLCTCCICYLGVFKDKFFAQNLLFLRLHPNNKLDRHLLRFHQLKNWKISIILTKMNVLTISFFFCIFKQKERNGKFANRVPWFPFYFCCGQSICPLVRLLTSWNTTCHFQHPLSGTSLWECPEILAWPAGSRESHTAQPASDKLPNISAVCLVQSVISTSTSNTATGMRDFLWPPS